MIEVSDGVWGGVDILGIGGWMDEWMDILNIYFFEYKNKNMRILLMKNLTKCKYLLFYFEICNTNIADAKSDKCEYLRCIN